MKPTKQPSVIAAILAIICGVFIIVASVLAAPFIVLLLGMAVGWLLEFVTGDYVVQAFNAIGLNSVQSGDLPKVFGLLALVAWVLRVALNNSGDFKRKGDE